MAVKLHMKVVPFMLFTEVLKKNWVVGTLLV